jgi:hypothetical protein
MTRPLRFLAVALATVATLAVPSSAAAAPASTSFAVRGFEYAFTPDVGFFAGYSAVGNEGDRGAWNAYVEHDRLGSTPPIYVNGGSFWMATRSPAGTYDWVSGTFVHHGGTITIDPPANCTNERYLVTGALENVTTSTTAGGTGAFSVTLTHYRASVLGRCITYSASVVGTVSFDYG